MRQLLQLGRKRNLFKASLPAAILGLFSAPVTFSSAKTPPRSAGDGPVTEVPPFVAPMRISFSQPVYACARSS